MIHGAHAILYTSDAEATRAFFRDTLGFGHVDAGQGWLIFALPPAEMGIHPETEGGRHELYFTCDDIGATMAALAAKGVAFSGPPNDYGWGILTTMLVPGGLKVGLYQPRHAMAHAAATPPSARRGRGRRPAGKAKGSPKRTRTAPAERARPTKAAKRGSRPEAGPRSPAKRNAPASKTRSGRRRRS